MHWMSHSNTWCGSGFFLWHHAFAVQPAGLDVLKGRYARGEIDEAMYLKMKQEL